MGALDPVELHVLAEHLRDRTWLDMRSVDYGTLERVRVAGIIIRHSDEELILEQEHSFDGHLQVSTLNVPRDGVRWCKASVFELDDVTVAEPKVKDGVEDDAIINTVKDVLAFHFKDHPRTPLKSRRDVEKMLKSSAYDSAHTHKRHVFVWLIWRFGSGKMSPASICGLAGYKSQMPWQSAKWKFRGNDADEAALLDKLMAARGHNPVRGD